jgi:hypothetical protein
MNPLYGYMNGSDDVNEAVDYTVTHLFTLVFQQCKLDKYFNHPEKTSAMIQ